MGESDQLKATVAAARAVLLPEVCFVKDLAAAFHCSESGIRSLIRRGEIPARRLGRRWVVERRALLYALTPDAVRLRLLPLSDGGAR